MRKMLVLLILALTLTGCAHAETLETVADEWDVPAAAIPKEMTAALPEEGGAEALESDTGRLYVTEDYSLSMETLAAGDLDATLTQLCGRGKDSLTVMERAQDGMKRYDFVWAAAGEEGEMLGRGAILDDGDYHYCMTLLRPADQESAVRWNQVFDSFHAE